MRPLKKVRKQFILDPAKIKCVRRILGVKTDTDAVDRSMDLVLAEKKIWETMESVRGKLNIKDVYGRLKRAPPSA